MAKDIHAITYTSTTYSYSPVNTPSAIAGVPLTTNFSVSAPSGTSQKKIGFQLSLSGTDNSAAGIFQVSVSEVPDSASFVPLLTTAQGTVVAGVFTGSSTKNLLLTNGPSNFNYIKVDWTGSATADTAKIVFQYEE